MQNHYRLYRRSNGMFYAQDSKSGSRESLGTKKQKEAEKLLQAKNDAYEQPALSRELAKAYLCLQDPKFCERTWGDVACVIDNTYTGSTKERFQKFLRSVPAKTLLALQPGQFASQDRFRSGRTPCQATQAHTHRLAANIHKLASRRRWPTKSASR